MAYPLSRGMEPFVLRCGLSGSDGALTKIGACSRAVAPDRGDLQASEPLISLRKQSRKQRRPHPLTRFVRDEVLANFECHMVQVPLLATDGDRINALTASVGS